MSDDTVRPSDGLSPEGRAALEAWSWALANGHWESVYRAGDDMAALIKRKEVRVAALVAENEALKAEVRAWVDVAPDAVTALAQVARLREALRWALPLAEQRILNTVNVYPEAIIRLEAARALAEPGEEPAGPSGGSGDTP